MTVFFDKIERMWHSRDKIPTDLSLKKQVTQHINRAIDMLEDGSLRATEKKDGKWVVNEVVQKAILLYFMVSKTSIIGSSYTSWYDKVPLLHHNYSEDEFQNSKSRYVPGAIIRKGVYIDQNVVVMPSFINIGAHIGSNSMVDTWATIGSCAQIGKNCHISGGVGIGGVLEPIGQQPVIIEDNCFIGSRSCIVEGAIVEENSVIGAGVFISASSKIIYRDTGQIIYGKVPKNSVVVPGSFGGDGISKPSLSCAVIIKTISEETRSKTSINDILRL